MDLKYCIGTPPPEDFDAINFLNSLNFDLYKDFVEEITSSISNTKSKAKHLYLKAQLGSYDKKFTVIKNIITKFRMKALDNTTISNDLALMGLKKDYTDILIDKISETKMDGVIGWIRGNQLLDVQWSFGITTNQHAYVDLYLTVAKKDGKIEKVEIELSLKEFYKLLSSIGRAHSVMRRYLP